MMKTDPDKNASKLPIGVSDFREMREDGFYYVDKTHLIK